MLAEEAREQREQAAAPQPCPASETSGPLPPASSAATPPPSEDLQDETGYLISEDPCGGVWVSPARIRAWTEAVFGTSLNRFELIFMTSDN